MKNLFQFLGEATLTAQAKEQARKMNLKSDGHGGWLNARGEYVAKTEGQRLKFFNKRQKEGEKDPAQKRKPGGEDAGNKPKAVGPVQQMAKRRADDDLAGAPLEKKPEEEGSEKEGKTLTTAFGRFNPPTIGHERLLSAAKKAAQGGDLKIYPSRSQDPKKNPLDPDMKVSYMRKMFPDYEEQIVNEKDMKTIFDVLTTASEEGYTSVNIVVGADRQAEFESLAQKYNGDLYDFDEIRVISAGVRDADAEGVEGMSASKMRKAVADGDYNAFKRGLPKKAKDADVQAVYDAVRTGMNIKKSAEAKKAVQKEMWQISPESDPRGLRENYFRKNIFNIGDMVESLNTGLVGEIIRRGTNYLISVTENNIMFKSWTHDLTEYTEKHMERRMRDKTHPNMLVGTGGARKNAQAMVHGQKKINNFNIREFINKYKIKK